jgi:glucose/arabinose dehydrogenase
MIAQHFARAPPVCYRTRGSSKASYGRPVGVTLGPDSSLLVADDVGDVIWRVTGETQA